MSSSVKTLLVGALMIFLLSACGGSGSQDQVEEETDNSQSEQPNVPEETSNSDTQDDGDSADTPQEPADENDSDSEGGAQDSEEGTDSADSDTQEEGIPESPEDAPVDEEPTTEPNIPDTQEDAPNNSESSDEESSTTEPNTPTDSEPSDDTSTDTSDTTTEEEPVAQTLDFSITSGHRSQALDGYIQVSGWAKDFENSTGGTNLQFQVDLRSSSDMFVRTPTISYSSGTLRYEVKPGAEGRVVLSIKLKDRDTGVESATKVGTFIVLAAPANVAPSFVGGSDKTTQNDAGAQAFAGWASGMQDNNTEAVQGLNFKIVSVSDRSLFTASPRVSYPSGTLRYTPKVGASGTATIKLVLEDDGAGTYGGENTSAEYEFDITITAPAQPVVVNKAPSFKNLGNQTVEADSGAFVLSAWAFDLDDGNEGTQSLSFEVVSNSNPGLFSASPTVSVPSGTLRFTPKAGESGTAEISIRLKDNGGVENGGVDVSGITTLVINIETINNSGLPPDPGEKGRETLLGIDSDNDGVRDDVQLAILSLYKDEPEDTQENLLNTVRLFQEVFINKELGSELDVKNSMVKFLEITSCAELTYEQITMLELLMVNTDDRSQKYIEANALMLGVSMQAHGAESDYCEF